MEAKGSFGSFMRVSLVCLQYCLFAILWTIGTMGAALILAGVGLQRLALVDRTRSLTKAKEWIAIGPSGAEEFHRLEISIENGPRSVEDLLDSTLTYMYERVEHQLNEDCENSKTAEQRAAVTHATPDTGEDESYW